MKIVRRPPTCGPNSFRIYLWGMEGAKFKCYIRTKDYWKPDGFRFFCNGFSFEIPKGVA